MKFNKINPYIQIKLIKKKLLRIIKQKIKVKLCEKCEKISNLLKNESFTLPFLFNCL